MKTRLFSVFVLVTVLALLLAWSATAQAPGETVSAPLTNAASSVTASQSHGNPAVDTGVGQKIAFVPERLIVKFRDQARPQTGRIAPRGMEQSPVNDFLAQQQVQRVESLFPTYNSSSKTPTQVDPGLERIYRLELAPGSNELQIANTLAADPRVEWAEPDYLAHTIFTPNDPLYAEQWGLSKVQAASAWDTTQGSQAVIIAVVDTGIDLTHPDLSAKIWVNPADNSVNGVDEDGNDLVDDVNGWNFIADNNDVTDSNGHGTQVAGVAAASTDNSEGIAGVCPLCQVMPVKVTQVSGVANYSDVALGIIYAADKGARVINLSLGGYADSNALRAAIEYAAGKGSVIVAGAGNDDESDPFYPAAYAQVLGVAGTAGDDAKASFSNYGSWVDVSAPAAAITTTFAGGGYGAVDGTSMAAPLAAGLAGLLCDQHTCGQLDPTVQALVRAQVIHTADSIEAQNPGYGGLLGTGRLNANTAVTAAPAPLLSVTSYTIDGQNQAPEPDSIFSLVVNLYNDWGPTGSLSGTLSSDDIYATIDDDAGFFSNIAPHATGDNGSDPFQVTLHSSTPYAHPIPFSLDLTNSDGSFTASLSFTVTVRSGFEHLPGGTVFVADETWTADKTYVLDGNVVVDEGVTLTIEPGTTVMVANGNWLRIDGTLIAAGTPELPISFIGAGESPTATISWAGLRFSNKSEAAVLDENEAYVSGSIIRHAHFEHAETAVGISGGAPFIADSVFDSNSTGVSIENNGQATIVDSQFTDNYYSGVHASDGKLSIADSTLTGNGTAISSDNGSLTVIGNTITDNENGISGNGWSNIAAQVRENVIMDNTGIGASLYGFVTFEYNLVANNGGAGLNVEINSSGNEQYNPVIAYNSQSDEYLVGWKESRDTGYDILAWRVSSDGAVVDNEIQVAATISDEHSIQLAYNPTQDQYLAVYYTGGAEPTDVYGRLLSGTGSPIGNPIPISTASTEQNNPQVTFISSQDSYLVVWRDHRNNDYYQLYGRLINSDGSFSSGETLLMDENYYVNTIAHSPAYNPHTGKALVGWYSSADGSWGQWLTISNTQIFTDTPFRIGEWDADSPTVTFNSAQQQFLVAWRYNNNIYVTVPPLSATLVVSATQQSYQPHLSYNPTTDEYLLVWRERGPAEYPDVYARYLDYNGSPVGSSFAVSTADESQDNARAAINAANGQSLVVWQDRRTNGFRIYGQRLASDGTLLDNPGTATDETDPSVNFRIAPLRGIRYNTIINNGGYGIHARGQYADSVSFGDNNLFGNGTYDFYLETNQDVDAADNYWGDTPLSQVPVRIYDCNDLEFGCPDADNQVGQVAYLPVGAAPIAEAPAFVQSVTVDPPLVGIQQATFDVTFSGAMDQGAPPDISFHSVKRGTNTTFTEADGLAENRVETIAVDRDGNIWLGARRDTEDSKGVSFYDGQDWISYTAQNSGLPGNAVSAIFADSSNRIWFSYDNIISRLEGNTWITYTPEISDWVWSGSNIWDISQTPDGAMWFAAQWDGLLYFDGTTWTHYGTDEGLPFYSVTNLAVDKQGHLWVGTDQGVAVYNGTGWTFYNTLTGLPGNNVYAIFVDSEGDVWVATNDETGNRVVSRFSNNTWTSFDYDSTDGALNCVIFEIAGDRNGGIWFATWCGTLVQYIDGTWIRNDLNYGIQVMVFDHQDNLWANSENRTGVTVTWGGDEYPVTENARWLDSTHYQATYDINALVPREDYNVVVRGARSSSFLNGTGSLLLPARAMVIPTYMRQSFSVDYAGSVGDTTPPPTPIVLASGASSADTLSAQWSVSDPDSPITLYRYAIGVTPGGTAVINWTDTTATSFTRTDLNLIAGQTYYVSVKARNAGGLWSDAGVSTGVTAGAGSAPTANFSASPTIGPASLNVQFSDVSSGAVNAWLWDFGDGITSTLQNPLHAFSAKGAYTVSLMAAGPGGNDLLVRPNYIIVTPGTGATPVAGFTASPLAGKPPLAVVFTDTSSGDITSWQWDFGDGGSSVSQNPTHTFTLTGTYTVSLTVAGPGGSDDKVQADYIIVSNKPVIANFTANPTSGPAPLSVRFSDASAGDITAWLWNFGDQTTGTLQIPAHTYAAAGIYTVSLTVSGLEGSDSLVRPNYISATDVQSVYLPLVLKQ